MPQHAPAGDSHTRKSGPKPVSVKPGEPRKGKAPAGKKDEDAAMREWRELAEFQFLDG